MEEGNCHCNRDRNLRPATRALAQDPSCSDAPRFGVTRHTVAPGCTCRLAPELRSLSDMCLQPHRSCDKRTANNRRAQPSPCPCSPTGPRKGPPRRPGYSKSALTPVPRGIRSEFAAPYATGYKLSLSGGFLFRAFRSAELQDVLFGGVFAPRLWNTACHQSASRNRPVGVRLRLYHRVPASYQLPFRSLNSCTRLWHRRRHPNSRAMRGGAHAAPPSGHYRTPLQLRDSNASRRSPHNSPPIGRRCEPWSQVGGFTHELPYEGLSVAILNTQTGLQRWHSDCQAPALASRISGRERNSDMHESGKRGNGNSY